MTTKTLLTSTALSLLLATSVAAQTDTGTTPPANDPAMTAPADGAAPMANDGMMDAEPQTLEEMTVGDLTGTDVMDANGDSIGSIRDVVQGVGEAEAVVGIGGFLGIGRYDVALPISDLNYNAADRVISVTLTREELEAMPEYDGADIEPLPADVQLSTLIVDTAPAGAPTTDAPATTAPAPATDAPATDAPATDAPATDAPATDAPATDAPATDAPATTDPMEEEGTTGGDTMETDTDTDAPTTTD